jgi:hypothetical protein
MSVIVTLRVTGDPAKFEQYARENGEIIDRIMEAAKRNGVSAHRWYARDGEFMAVDEWPDESSFQAFFEQAQPDIGPAMQASAVTTPPEVTFWRTADIDDAIG